MDVATRLRGCLLAGAVGDALGAPLEFLSRSEIRSRWGRLGPKGYVTGNWPAGSITDDTQMTLFTAEGMIRARTRLAREGEVDPTSVVHNAYVRWLHTQGDPVAPELLDGWLVKQEVLHHQRAPGNTCLSGLRSGHLGTPEAPLNDSKGCGTVMRMAPAALWEHALLGFDAFDEGVAYGALTHGHPTGYLASGVFARMIAELLKGSAMDAAVGAGFHAMGRHGEREQCREVARAVGRAVDLAFGGTTGYRGLKQLGEGWVAEEALAIGIYCFLTAPDLRTGLRLAVSHGGDSDSTGAIAGNLLGAFYGPEAIPKKLLEGLEAREVIEQVSQDLAAHFLEEHEDIEGMDLERYPGW